MPKRRSLVALILLFCSADVLVLHAKPAASLAVIYIRANGSVEPPSAPIDGDGYVYTFTDDIHASIIVERDGVTIDGNGHRLWGQGNGNGIALFGRRSVTVSNLTIESFRVGVWLNGSSSNTLYGNNLTANAVCGILLHNHSAGNTISGNIARANFDAVYLYCSSSNIISGNDLSESDEEGIELFGSSDNIISENNVTANIYDGIALINSSSNNTVTGNVVVNNICGIWVYSFSNNNTIRRNNVTSNYRGICVESSSNNVVQGNSVKLNQYDGIALDQASSNSLSRNDVSKNHSGIELYKSSNNKICHNSIHDNTVQASSHGSFGDWDDGYPSGGNYWSDYTGVDLHYGLYQNKTGSDGIGDEGYEVDVANVDKYPLMSPIIVFEAGMWDSVLYSVSILSNSSISDFHFDPEAACITLNVTSKSGTGFCRLSIPKNLLQTKHGWITLLNGQPIADCTVDQDEDYTYLYLAYNCGNGAIEIIGTDAIPSYSSSFLAAFVTSTLLMTIIVKRRKRRIQQDLIFA